MRLQPGFLPGHGALYLLPESFPGEQACHLYKLGSAQLRRTGLGGRGVAVDMLLVCGGPNDEAESMTELLGRLIISKAFVADAKTLCNAAIM